MLNTTTTRTQAALGLGALAVVLAGCTSASADGATTSANGSTTSVIVESPDDLPDPCTLLADKTLRAYVEGVQQPTRNAPATNGDEVLLFRTCAWGNPDDFAAGAVGVQIGVPTESGHDVVANRSTALDPALDTDIGEDGKETVLVGEMPTGGGKGASIFFRYAGYSILIGQVGERARTKSVESMAREVMRRVDAFVEAAG